MQKSGRLVALEKNVPVHQNILYSKYPDLRKCVTAAELSQQRLSLLLPVNFDQPRRSCNFPFKATFPFLISIQLSINIVVTHQIIEFCGCKSTSTNFVSDFPSRYLSLSSPFSSIRLGNRCGSGRKKDFFTCIVVYFTREQ